MKMKNYIYAALLLCLSSCVGFLEEIPTTSLSEETVYSTEYDLEAGVIGCYASMRGTGGWQGELNEYLQYASCLVRWKNARTTENWTQTLTLSMFPKNTINERYYNFFYSSIYTCNRFIENLPSSPVDPAFKNEVEAEARLIRAIAYFGLVRQYGDVPLILQTAKNIQETASPRVSYMRVYEQILKDIEFAETYMRGPDATRTAGRPHKWAATSFKVAVYAQIACMLENKEYHFFDLGKEGRTPDFSFAEINSAQDAWRLSLKTAESVMECKVYALADSYADLFRWTNPEDFQLKERVFALQASDNAADGIFVAARTLPLYPEGSSNVSVNNVNAGRIRPERYVLQKWSKIHGGTLENNRSDALTTIYTGCKDPRFDLSYFHTKYTRIDNGSTERLYPASGRVAGKNAFEPYFKKYLSPGFDLGCGTADFYLMRYAEVILYAAEAAASLSAGPGDTHWNKAMAYMELIHARARRSVEGGSEYPHMSSWGTLSSSKELVDAIMWERVFEMHGEGHEFFDTHRRGAKFMSEWLAKPLNEFLKMPEQGGDANTSGSVFMHLYYSHFIEEDPQKLRRSILLAFPDVEFRNNPAITSDQQNDFYVDYLE